MSNSVECTINTVMQSSESNLGNKGDNVRRNRLKSQALVCSQNKFGRVILFLLRAEKKKEIQERRKRDLRVL